MSERSSLVCLPRIWSWSNGLGMERKRLVLGHYWLLLSGHRFGYCQDEVDTRPGRFTLIWTPSILTQNAPVQHHLFSAADRKPEFALPLLYTTLTAPIYSQLYPTHGYKHHGSWIAPIDDLHRVGVRSVLDNRGYEKESTQQPFESVYKWLT